MLLIRLRVIRSRGSFSRNHQVNRNTLHSKRRKRKSVGLMTVKRLNLSQARTKKPDTNGWKWTHTPITGSETSRLNCKKRRPRCWKRLGSRCGWTTRCWSQLEVSRNFLAMGRRCRSTGSRVMRRWRSSRCSLTLRNTHRWLMSNSSRCLRKLLFTVYSATASQR